MESATAKAPSSTANMGPGFDVFGMALDAFWDEVTISRSSGGITIDADGSVPAAPEKNTAGVVADAILTRYRIKSGVCISIRKGVPAGFGMGSSAASAAAAAAALDELFELGMSKNEMVRHAGAAESASAGAAHYDNAAASVLGGFVLVRTEPLRLLRLEPPEDMILCLGIPDIAVPEHKTQVSRSLIPETVSVPDMTKNLANASAMALGFQRGDTGIICEAMQDDIVEPARKQMIPGYDEAKRRALDAGACGFAISGAGPTVIAVMKRESQHVADSIREGFASYGTNCRTILCRPCGGAECVR